LRKSWIGRADIAGPPLPESAERSIFPRVRLILAVALSVQALAVAGSWVSIRDPDVTAIAWERQMRDTTLGRWMVRLAVTVGAGAVALGMSTAMAHASSTHSEGSAVKLVGVIGAAQFDVDRIHVTEDWGWS
jgi:hypothetical protein